MDQVIKRAATLPVLRLVTHEADLEEVFLSYYAGGWGREHDRRDAAGAGPTPRPAVVVGRHGRAGPAHRRLLSGHQGPGPGAQRTTQPTLPDAFKFGDRVRRAHPTDVAGRLSQRPPLRHPRSGAGARLRHRPGRPGDRRASRRRAGWSRCSPTRSPGCGWPSSATPRRSRSSSGSSRCLAVASVALSAPFGALEGVSIAGLVGACAAVGCLALLHGSIAFAVGAATGGGAPHRGGHRRRRGRLPDPEPAVPRPTLLDPFRFVNPWHWYLKRNMLVDGVPPEAVLAPLGRLGGAARRRSRRLPPPRPPLSPAERGCGRRRGGHYRKDGRRAGAGGADRGRAVGRASRRVPAGAPRAADPGEPAAAAPDRASPP